MEKETFHQNICKAQKHIETMQHDCDVLPLEQRAVFSAHLQELTEIIGELQFAILKHMPQQSDEQYRALFENKHTAMLLIDPKTGQIVDANPAATAFYGYTREDLLKLKISDINVLPDNLVKKEMEKARHEQRIYFNFKHRLANGEIRDVEVYSGPIAVDSRQLLYSVIHDNTERIKAEEALKISEERYRVLFEEAIEGIVQTTPEGKYLNVNQSYVRMMGYDSADEMIQSVTDVASQIYANPEDRARLLGLLAASDRVENFEGQAIRKNGQKIWVSMNVNAVRNHKGELIRLDSRLMDITLRKKTEDSMRANEERLHLATLSGNIGIWDWDVANGALTWDDSMYALYGIRREDFADDFDAWLKILHPDDHESTKGEIQAAIRGEREFASEFRIVRPDNTVRIIQAASHTFRDRDGNATRMIGTNIDITERNQVEEQLQLSNEKLIVMVSTLEQRNHEANLVHEMDDLLQACNTPEEAYMVVQQFGALLFPHTSGALFLISEADRMVEAAATWGEELQSERIFSIDTCWILRRGRVQYWSSLSPGLQCSHFQASIRGDYLGVPMMAAGKLLGMLHIESSDHHLNDEGVGELALTITERLALTLTNIQLREKLHALSIRDPLTGLFNRRFMEEYLERELNRANRKQTCVGVIMLDIDHFKNYNDTFGHSGGDEVLRKLGALLQTHIRGGDIACRFGGEEFILILPETPMDVVRQRAEQIREAVQGMKVEFHRKSLGTITVSMGAAVFPDHGVDSAVLLYMADKALYNAKHNGRNCVEIAT